MIFTLEGIDASGKATQAKKLAEKLKASTYDFPRYQTLTGQAILGLLTGKWGISTFAFRNVYEIDVGDLPPEKAAEYINRLREEYKHRYADDELAQETSKRVRHLVEQTTPEEKERAAALRALVLQSLMTTNRLEVGPMLEAHARDPLKHLVLDRYFASGLVYGTADGLSFDYLVDIHKLIPPSDLWIYVDIPPQESKRRRPERRDEYETREGFMEKVREQYLNLFSSPGSPSVIGGKWVIVDGLGTPEEVHERIMSEVRSIL